MSRRKLRPSRAPQASPPPAHGFTAREVADVSALVPNVPICADAFFAAVQDSKDDCKMHPRIVRVGTQDHSQAYIRDDVHNLSLLYLRQRLTSAPATPPAPVVDVVKLERDRIVAEIRRRAVSCRALGSSTRANLLHALATEIETGGPLP